LTFNNGTTSTSSTAGQFNFNNATVSSVTNVYINNTSGSSIANGDTVWFTFGTTWAEFQVSATPTLNTTTYTIPVTFVSNGGTFTNGITYSFIQSRRGLQGIQGFQGLTGAGSQGVQGIQGLQGVQGFQGLTGAGSQGVQGIQGLQGLTGAGSQGVQGIQGLQGLVASQGIQGLQGIQSFQGIQGLQGTSGSSGGSASPTFTGTVTLPTSTNTVAPLILPAGTLLTTPAAGVIESDGANIYFTGSTTLGRNHIDTSMIATTGIYAAPLQNITTAQALWGGYVSATGTLGAPTGTGPWTVVVTGMSFTGGFIPGKTITSTAGTGSFNTNTVTISSVDSATQITVSATGGTTPTAGTVTNITTTTTGALSLPANTSYMFEQMLYVTTGATSHTTAIGFGGNVGVSSIWHQTDSGLTAVSGTIQASGTSGLSTIAWTTLAGGVAEAATTATNTAWRTKGLIRTTTSGTIIPQITFSAAPGTPISLSPTSFFRITPIGSNSFYTIGAWA
jgi:hypothetical protein